MDAGISIKRFDTWQIAICLMAALPSIFVLATWDSDGLQTPRAFAVRYLSLPVTICELCIIWLAVRTKFDVVDVFKKLGRIPKLFIAIWFVFALIPIPLADYKMFGSTFATLQYALHGIFLAAAVHLARTSKVKMDRRTWSVSVIALGGLTYVGFITLFALLVPDKDGFPWVLRLPSGTNIRQLGYFAAIASVPSLSLILFGRSKIALFCFAFIVSIAFIGWSGSRGALAGLLVGTALATLFIGRAISIFRAGIAFCSLVSGLMLSLFLPTPAPEFGILRIVSSIKGDDLGNGRSAVWESAFTEFLITPWIGHGTGSFNQNMRELYGFDYNHPHQFILQYFYDWGAIGGAAGGLLLFILFLSCLRYGRQHKDVAAYASIASLCTIAVVGMIDGALFYPLSIFLAIVAVACGFVIPPKNLTTL